MSNNIIIKDIPGFEGQYQVTSNGQVYSLKSNKFLTLSLEGEEGKKYYYVGFTINGKRKNYRVSRLVAMTFIPNPNNLPIVNHKDENKLNNNVENLEWCDYTYNNHYNNRIQRAVNTKKNNGNCAKTIMCDKITHEEIKRFISISEAIEYLNLSKNATGNISAVMAGRKKSAYGYFWKKWK